MQPYATLRQVRFCAPLALGNRTCSSQPRGLPPPRPTSRPGHKAHAPPTTQKLTGMRHSLITPLGRSLETGASLLQPIQPR